MFVRRKKKCSETLSPIWEMTEGPPNFVSVLHVSVYKSYELNARAFCCSSNLLTSLATQRACPPPSLDWVGPLSLPTPLLALRDQPHGQAENRCMDVTVSPCTGIRRASRTLMVTMMHYLPQRKPSLAAKWWQEMLARHEPLMQHYEVLSPTCLKPQVPGVSNICPICWKAERINAFLQNPRIV